MRFDTIPSICSCGEEPESFVLCHSKSGDCQTDNADLLPKTACQILWTQALPYGSVIAIADVHVANWSFFDPAVVGCYEAECFTPFPHTHIVQLFLVHNPEHCRDVKMVIQGSNCRS
jgi:hypothetical protein